MTTVNDILQFLSELAPPDLAEEWDNVGLLVGDKSRPVCRAALALDITADVVREAAALDETLIISHHPVIFHPMETLSADSVPYLLAQHGIAAISMHTNLDRAANGVNTALANALGLQAQRFYPDDFILVGEPERAFTPAEFAAFVKERLHAPSVRYTDGGAVRQVAVSSGGGGNGIELCERYNFDAFVTGELKHHQYLFARKHGISAFDAGHFSTENVVIKPLLGALSNRFGDVEFIESNANPCPYRSV